MQIVKREAIARLRCGLASQKDLEALGADEVRAAKTDSDVTQYRFGDHPVRAVKEDDEQDGEERTFEHDASTEHVDSMGDIIRVAGWDTKRIKTGRIPLEWGHDYSPVPLGLVRSAKRGKSEDGVKSLVTTSRFHEPALYADSEWGKHVGAVRTLVARGDLPGVSVGFAVRDYRWPDDVEREKEGLGQYGVIFEAQELLELSVTPVPANGRANLKKSLARYGKTLDALVLEGALSVKDAEDLMAQLAVSEESWLARLTRATPRALVAMRSLPTWAAGAETKSDAAPLDVDQIVARVGARIATLIRAEVTAVTRDIVEPAEDGIQAAVERIEQATAGLVRATQRTDQRAEIPPPSEPTGSDAAQDQEAGKGRDPHSPSALKALEALV